MPVVTGFLVAVASAICNGTFGVLSKTSQIKEAQVSPHVFNFWASWGVALSALASCVVIPTQGISPWGILSGIIFVLAIGSSFVAISLLDSVAIATGVWCGIAMVSSFVAGAITGDKLNPWLAAAAMALMIYSVMGITLLQMPARNPGTTNSEGDDMPLLLNDQHQAVSNGFIPGMVAACVAGVFGGLILFPMKFSTIQGFEYLPSMGIGVIASLALPLFLHLVMPNGKAGKEQHMVAALPAMISGLIWNAGNAFSMIAVNKLGLAVAYPIMQSGLFVAAVWGIFLFGELPSRKERLGFLLYGSLVLLGVLLLSLSTK